METLTETVMPLTMDVDIRKLMPKPKDRTRYTMAAVRQSPAGRAQVIITDGRALALVNTRDEPPEAPVVLNADDLPGPKGRVQLVKIDTEAAEPPIASWLQAIPGSYDGWPTVTLDAQILFNLAKALCAYQKPVIRLYINPQAKSPHVAADINSPDAMGVIMPVIDSEPNHPKREDFI